MRQVLPARGCGVRSHSLVGNRIARGLWSYTRRSLDCLVDCGRGYRPDSGGPFPDVGRAPRFEAFDRAVLIAAAGAAAVLVLTALLREREPTVRFVHTGVDNASRKYPNPIAATPCTVVCLECAGDEQRLNLYRRFRQRDTIGQFVVFRQE
jgi:hypothetical protein